MSSSSTNDEKVTNEDNLSTITSPSTGVQPAKGRVLMIHGWAQNANVMRIKTKTLTRKLNQAGFDCIFIDAPFLLPMKSTVEVDGAPVEIDNGRRENARAWFLYSESDPADASLAQAEKPMSYIGLNESLNRIKCVLEDGDHCDEFCAVLGFSQGSVFAHLLSAIACNPCDETTADFPLQKIRCIILASGFPAMHNGLIIGNVKGVTCLSDLNIPSLHVIGEKDTSVSPELSSKLASCFCNSELMMHEKGHIIPQKSAQCAQIITFLEKCRSAKDEK